MKKILWFLVVFSLMGCEPNFSAPVSNSSRDNPSSNSSGAPSNPTPASSLGLSGSSSGGDSVHQNNSANNGNKNIDIIIPSQNKTAPNGILEQLAWSSTGGGEPDKQLCGDCSPSISESSLILSDFSPFQKLNFGIYRKTGNNECYNNTADFVMSVDVQVDENGNLTSTINEETANLFIGYVIDINTNEMIWEADYGTYGYIECTKADNSQGECPGAPAQRLEVNKMAYVCTASETVKLRDGPGKNYSEIKSLVPGADIKIIGGPKCANDWSWWQVRTESGYEGWMTEGGDSSDPYFLCPKK